LIYAASQPNTSNQITNIGQATKNKTSPMTSAALRAAFLKFFENQRHTVVSSSPLVPANDPTLLFTNAGMVQFKEAFLGLEDRGYKRAVSCQRCVRAGGKHNDLDNVGYTARHHTFFEMLGNFSFGDYFKHEAIRYAWDFLTGTLKLPPERLWITVFETDDEAAEIWLKEIGIDPKHLTRCGEKDNFWTMGPTGPCGPSSEIFYDHGADIPGGPPGSADADGDRYVEIWNLVFTQYDRDSNGKLNPIPRPSVDTGMGLERVAAVMQGVHNNYDTDLFTPLLAAVQGLMNAKPQDPASMRVVADHIRSCAFIVADGVIPSNEGRGYVLRRIIRRAIRHGHKLGIRGAFFHRLVAPLVGVMGAAYPELAKAQAQVEQVLRLEEERFAETLEQGLKLLEEAIAGLRGKIIPGSTVFKLYDTYGFPEDLTADIARERNLSLDHAGFEREMQAQRERGRSASQFGATAASELPAAETLTALPATRFTGYEGLEDQATVQGLFVDRESVESLSAGVTGVLVLDHSPFYAESGGQIGDKGLIKGPNGVFEVLDTRKRGAVCLHIGDQKLGEIKLGESVRAEVATVVREPTRLNHSATHLMHAALRHVLGTHVQQKGSLVAPDRLRFDFSHPEPVSAEQITRIEQEVNTEIRANHEVQTKLMPIQQAVESGAMALFGEKYDEQVRVLDMGGYSVELCGGTHVRRTGDIGLFKIITETGVAAGVRRIEAVTGEAAINWMQETEAHLQQAAELLKGNRASVVDRLSQLLQRSRQMEKDAQTLKAKLATGAGKDLSEQAVNIGGVKVLAISLEQADVNTLRDTLDKLKDKLGSAALVLASVEDGKVRLVAGVTKDVMGKVPAGELVNFVAQQIGGKGGGRPDMAQAGGTNPEALPGALESVAAWVGKRLAQ
jgi:alanyl-tRNA synthetase